MDLSIMSRQSVRDRVARLLALRPEEGQDGAIRRCAEDLNWTEESVREVMAFAEESA
jgi:hypothetical protein